MSVIAEDELATARSIAYWVGSKWSLVEVEDLQQELTLWLFENADTVDRYHSDPDGKAKLHVALRKHALKYCAREQSARSGAPLDHDAPYTLAQVRRAVPFLFEDIAPEVYVQENPHTDAPVGAASHSYGLGMAVLLDLKMAFADMPAEVKTHLTLQYRDGLTYREIAELTGVSRRTAIRHGQQALTKLRDRLCGYV